MNKKIIFLILILVVPLFFIKSSNIELSSQYQNIKLKSTNSIVINKTAYSFNNNFTINASAYGYLDSLFKFNHDDSKKLIILEEIPVEVIFRVESTDNYVIKINNNDHDSTDSIFLPKGSHEYSIASDGYITYKSILNINSYTKQLLVPVLLTKIDKLITIESVPSNSSLIVNGTYIGLTPYKLNLNTQLNEIKLQKNGYKEKLFKIAVSNNTNENFLYKLDKLDTLISINTTPSQATLFLNDEYMGLTPLSLQDTINGKIKISKYGYKDIVYNLDDSKKSLNFELEQSTSNVFINTDPSSKVFINGNFISNTPIKIELQQIKHEIIFKKDSYETITKTIEPQTKEYLLFEKLITKKQSILNKTSKKYTNSIGAELILFQPGQVTIGSSKNQSRRDINEVLRNVEISKHFYFSKNLITERQFKNFINTTPSSNLPVNNISWTQAAKFCNWLSKKENLIEFYIFKGDNLISFNMKSNGYRLPTEAEWEYISKSNSNMKLIYQWGDNRRITKLVGNIADENTASLLTNYVKDYNDGYITRSPVGLFKPNQNGINDLTGNLSEWINDFYSSDIVSSERIFKDYIGPSGGSSHVIKGSNYNSSSPLQLGISYRTYGRDADELVGFRVARWIY